MTHSMKPSRFRLICALSGFLLMAAAAAPETEREMVTRYLQYPKLNRITAERIDTAHFMAASCIDPKQMPGPHIRPGIHIYVNDSVLETRRKNKTPGKYPAGSVIVKEKFTAKKSEKPDIITVMEKTGTTGEVNDWTFTMIRLSDHAIIREGFEISCAECHARHEQTGFVTPQTDRLIGEFADKKDGIAKSPAERKK